MTEHLFDATASCNGPPVAEPLHGHAEVRERLALIGELKAQIRSGVYRPDIRDLARSLATMMVHNL